MCALPSVAVLAAQNKTGAAFLFGVVGCGLIAYALWLLVSARRASAAEARHQAAQRQRAVYVAAKEYVAHLERMSAMESLLSLTPKDFESAIVDLLKFWGYTHVRRSGRRGDIICRNAGGVFTVVHCKSSAPDNLVEPGEVETVIETVVAQRAEQGVFVTTSGYTESAQALGQKHGIRMIDGTELVAHMQGIQAAKD
jgi:restriction endonuclease Mrr